MNSNFKVIGLTRLGIKSKSTAREADARTTRPSELTGPRSEVFSKYVKLKTINIGSETRSGKYCPVPRVALTLIGKAHLKPTASLPIFSQKCTTFQ